MPTRDRTGLGTAPLLALRAARETGVLDALMDRAGTPAEVMAEAGVTEAAADRMVDVLADLGFLEEVDGEYEPTNRALGLLAKRDVRSIGAVPHALDTVDALVDLPNTMETGVPPEEPDDATLHRLGSHAMTGEAVVRACVTAAVRAAPDGDRVVDLCGGSGVYAAEFAARGRDVTLVDSADAVVAIEPMYRDATISLHAGTPTTLDGSFHLAFAAGTASSMDPAEVQALLDVTAGVLDEDGTIVLADVFSDGTEADASEAAVTADIAGLATGHGGAHDVEAVREWLRAAGFDDVRVERIPGTDLRAATGCKRTLD
ncbi:class I SAM-dependent methyltransferase [Halorarum halophilum]|uniref:Class I SAM-dependent methyltransferase n=1 Tax=Halorarum halophilum TaxID=2743090 RepID=A0A7D5KHJ8_9EURY|nr:class I SAM-dependent methyltransferase [Halobaculum halophilum]QLG29216.1 class I SAM-dependent methyltransferase [Halobaculum halophilum]